MPARVGPAFRSTPASAPQMRTFARPAAPPRASLGTPKNVSFAPLPVSSTKPASRLAASRNTPNGAVRRLPASTSSGKTSAKTAVAAKAGAAKHVEEEADEHQQDELLDTMDAGGADMAMDDDDFAPMDDGVAAYDDDEGDEIPNEEATAAAAHTPAPARGGSSAAAATATPWRTPAGAAPEARTPATAVPASGWQRMYDEEEDVDEDEKMAAAAAAEENDGEAEVEAEPWTDDGTLPLDSDARLPFYLIDAHEEISQPGSVFLFGKVPAGTAGQFVSCCAVVRNMSRTLFFVPREPVTSSEIAALHAAATEGDGDDVKLEAKKKLIPALHAAFSAVKTEARALLTKNGVTQMTMKPVMRQYAFENKDVRPGKQWVLKVRCSASQPTIPLGTVGDTFSAVFGANQSPLESLMLKRRIMGPSWVALEKPRRVDAGSQVSFCRLEVEIEGHKTVYASKDGARLAPPLTVAAVHLKTAVNPNNGANEAISVSVVYLPKVSTDGPTPFNRRDLRHFSAVRRMEGVGFPQGFDAEVKRANESELGRRNGGAVLAMQPNERALLTMLVMRLKDLDADVYVGHNFAAYDLDVMLHRMQALKVPHWAALGRLKRSKFPNLGGGGHSFGGGAGAGQLSVVAGRLLCDTYLSARDLVKETDYTLTTLSKSLLGEIRCELASSDIPGKFATAPKLMELVQLTESDAWLSLRLAFYLVVLPLSRQVAELSGSLWSKSLLNQRAQRIEYLLLHEFHNNKFLLPDKISQKDRERLEKISAAAGGIVDGIEDDEENQRPGNNTAGVKKGGKGPQYAGGLVLEPKKGLYERYILLLDFNSLYPSIIQEYNICFTTVNRPEGGGVPALPEPSEDRAPLPRVIGALVARRRRVKEMIKGERDAVKREQLNIRQQALKLLANSMYGCLGFSNSRFFARPIAELITSQGREILQSTVDLVQGTIGREVVYGDTDSIMINTDSESLSDVIALGQIIKKEVNKRYRLLEIEMDGVFKCMLLLKKKKYAAVKVERAADGTEIEAVEAKGLDMVRRDWCPLAKQASQFALDQILSCRHGVSREEVVAAIHDHLTALAAAVNAGTVPLNKYIITKQLTKRPEDYPDAKNQPHVQVALRRRASGKRDGVMAGETVPYVICLEVAEDGTVLPAAKALADRAYSPDEISGSNGRLKIDPEYYIGQQVFPVVSRLVAPIDGTDAGRIAESLGLDPTKFKGAAAAVSGVSREDALAAAAAGLDDEDRFKSCAPLILTSPSGKPFEFRGVRDLLRRDTAVVETALLPAEEVGDESALSLSPAQVANQVQLRLRDAVGKYYENQLRSDDDMMPCPTRNLCLRESADGRVGAAPPDLRCSGAMHQVMTEAALYTQLQYVHRLFDVDGAMHALGDSKDAKLAAEDKLKPIRAALDAGAAAARRLRDRSAYRWINLGSVFGQVSA